MYNSQNDIIWTVNHVEADDKDGIKQMEKFPQKVIVWLEVCSKGLTPLIIFDKGTLDHECYIKEVLPVPKNYEIKYLGMTRPTKRTGDGQTYII